MHNLRSYTFEIVRPCYPYKGRDLLYVHKGTFNEVRDYLSPDMLDSHTKLFHDRKEAIQFARIYSKQNNVKLESH
jgi:hypothetical protein